jgi:hypothetical protein
MYAVLVAVFASAFAEIFVKELVNAIGLWSCLWLGMGGLVLYYTLQLSDHFHGSPMNNGHFHGCKSQINNQSKARCTCGAEAARGGLPNTDPCPKKEK